MDGEFFMIYDAIDVSKIKKLSNLSDEAIKSGLANQFLELVSGFDNISKKKFKREFAVERTINLFSEFAIYRDLNRNLKTNTATTEAWEEFKKLEIEVNPKFEYIVNELTKNFTGFKLEEFIALSGKYTKTLYRLLKQFRKTGKRICNGKNLQG